jgi:hypothetical protein
LTQEILDDDHEFEEEWIVRVNTGGKYILSKLQAKILQQEIFNGNRGIIMFKTFSISIPYIAEFYREKRFLKDTYQLPSSAVETEYVPIPPEKWEAIRKRAYSKIGKLPIDK